MAAQNVFRAKAFGEALRSRRVDFPAAGSQAAFWLEARVVSVADDPQCTAQFCTPLGRGQKVASFSAILFIDRLRVSRDNGVLKVGKYPLRGGEG